MHRVISILLFIFSISFSYAQKTISFNQLSVKNERFQKTVVCMAQDTTGYLWIATQNGLNKFEGNSFKHYFKQFGIVTKPDLNKLGKVFIDKQNNVWIITRPRILEKLNKKTNTFKPLSNIENVSIIFQDKISNIWIGTYSNGLYKIDAKTNDTIRISNNFLNKDISAIIQNNANQLFIACENTIVNINIKSLQCSQVLIDNNKTITGNFSSFSTSKNGTIWLGSYNDGLFYKEKNNKSFISYPFTIRRKGTNQKLSVQALLVDNKNRLWISTFLQGLFVLDIKNNKWQQFSVKQINPFVSNYTSIFSMFKDHSGTIWLGVESEGLSYYDEKLAKFNGFINTKTQHKINLENIRAIAKKDGKLWLSTFNDGLKTYDFNKDSWKLYNTKNSNLSSNRVMSLSVFNDELWIGLQNEGLNILKNDGTFLKFNTKTPITLSAETIWCMYQDSKQRIWLGTRKNGLIQFDKNKGIIKHYKVSKNNDNGIVSNQIRTIVEGEKDDLWLGTEANGIIKFNTNTETFTNYKTQLTNKTIRALYYNTFTAVLWIGTDGGGLNALNTKNNTFYNYTTKDGLYSNVINGILTENQNSLWLSTRHGLSKLNIPKDLNAKPKIMNYDNHNNLQSLEFNIGASYKDKNGNLFFGGENGVNWFHPNQIEQNTITPKTIISKVEIFNNEVPFIENKNYNSDENSISFTFSALQFSFPEATRFKYRLLNKDSSNKNWIHIENEHQVNFANLNSGNYTFQVTSSNYDGVWSKKPATYAFTILKPWYLTAFSKIIYALLLIALGFAIYNYFKWRWNIKTQLQLEQAEAERLKKIDDFKTKLFTNISHEFRTPLTLISGPIDNQLAKPNLSKTDKKELSLVKQNANRLLNLVNQMLDLSLLDSGELKLKVSKGNLNVMLKQIVDAFQYKAEKKNIIIKSNIKNLKSVWFDADVIQKIVSNLLSNAIKYAPKQSKIFFNANPVDKTLILTVINTNASIGRKNLGKLFQRFYQNDKASEGVGVGLALVKELITLSKGSIIANTLDDTKIQFTVTLPIYKKAFNDSEIIKKSTSIINDDIVEETSTKNKPSILIVEDHKDIRELVCSIFNKNYHCIKAVNGERGIKKALKYSPDIIISDVMMPKIDGIELCNELKYNELTSHIPIILLTAKVGEENEIKGLKTGADAYITKPFSSEKLKLRVEKLIENRKQLQRYFSKDFSITPDLAITSTETEFLKRLQTTLKNHITNPNFTSDKFSELMLMSRTHLHRKLKAIIGLTTTEFIRSQRLKLATKLLKETDGNVSEIAYQVGFSSPSYFIKRFKETYNCTPNEYALKLKG